MPPSPSLLLSLVQQQTDVGNVQSKHDKKKKTIFDNPFWVTDETSREERGNLPSTRRPKTNVERFRYRLHSLCCVFPV